MTITKLIDLSHDQKHSFLSEMNNTICGQCGCEGIHACLGKPVVWTEDDKLRFKMALGDMFGWQEPKECTAIFKVKVANYCPEKVTIRQQISPYIFTANFSSTDYQLIQKDEQVESISLNQKLRNVYKAPESIT